MKAYIYAEEDYAVVSISDNGEYVDSFVVYSFDESVIERIIRNDYPEVKTVIFDF